MQADIESYMAQFWPTHGTPLPQTACNVMQCNLLQCNVLQCNVMQCNVMQCNAM